MTDMNTQLRDYLDSISSPITVDEVTTQSATAPGGRKGLRRGPLVALAAFVAVLVVLGGAVLFSDGGDETPEVVGPVESTTLEEVDAAVRAAVDVIVEAPGFVVTQETFFDSQPGQSTWVTARQGGDFIALTARDPSAPGSGTGTSSGVEIAARTYVNGSLYQASTTPDDDTPWFEVEEAQTPDDPHLPIGVPFPDGLYPANLEDLGEDQQTAATRQSLSNGGIQLTVTQSSDSTGSSTTVSWEIHPDGHLAAYSLETNQSSSPEFPVPSNARLEFSLLTDPAPISPPTVGSPLDVTQHDIPEDLDLLR